MGILPIPYVNYENPSWLVSLAATKITGTLAKSQQHTQTAYLDASDQTFVGINRFGASDIYRVGQFATATGGVIEFGMLGGSTIGIQSLDPSFNFQTLRLQPNGGALSVGGAATFNGAIGFKEGVWNISNADSARRLFFQNNSTTYIAGNGSNPVQLRNASEQSLVSFNSNFETVFHSTGGGSAGVIIAGAATFNGNVSIGGSGTTGSTDLLILSRAAGYGATTFRQSYDSTYFANGVTFSLANDSGAAFALFAGSNDGSQTNLIMPNGAVTATGFGVGVAADANLPFRALASSNATVGMLLNNTSTGSSASSVVIVQSDAGQAGFRQYSAAHSVWPGWTVISSPSGGNGLALITSGTGNPIDFHTDNTLRATISDTGMTVTGSTKLGIKTIATLPSAASSSGERYQVSDSATIANRIAFSNGSAWYYEGTAVAV